MRQFIADGRRRDALRPVGRRDVPPSCRATARASGRRAGPPRPRAGRSTARTRRSSRTTTGSVHFMAKKERTSVVLDLEAPTYETEIAGKRFLRGGVVREPARDRDPFEPTRKYVCFREEGGRTPGAYARHGNDRTFSTIFQGINGVYDDDKTVGIAPSPDIKRLYASIQEAAHHPE